MFAHQSRGGEHGRSNVARLMNDNLLIFLIHECSVFTPSSQVGQTKWLKCLSLSHAKTQKDKNPFLQRLNGRQLLFKSSRLPNKINGIINLEHHFVFDVKYLPFLWTLASAVLSNLQSIASSPLNSFYPFFSYHWIINVRLPIAMETHWIENKSDDRRFPTLIQPSRRRMLCIHTINSVRRSHIDRPRRRRRHRRCQVNVCPAHI